jgi:tetratricopeptide (TPR) repeat protein
MRWHWHDGYAWLQKFLEIGANAPASVRGRALRIAGFLEPEKGQARCEESLALARASGERWNIAWSLADLGCLGWATSADVTEAIGLLAEALHLFRELQDGWGVSHALRRLGWVLVLDGNYDRAATLLEEALTLARQARNQHAISWSLFLLGNAVLFQTRDYERTMALHRECAALLTDTHDKQLLRLLMLMSGRLAVARGDFEQAESHYAESVALAREYGDIDDQTYLVVPVVLGFAQLAMARGQAWQAAKLFGAAHTALDAGHWILGDRASLDVERELAATRAELGEAAFEAAYAEGQAMTMEQALALAIESRELKPAPA